MGGRLALCLSQIAKKSIDQLILVAPEGLRPNIWFKMATGTLLGRFFFKWMMTHPKNMIALSQFFKKIGWINQSKVFFVERLMRNQAKRAKSYQVWMCFRKLKVDSGRKLFEKVDFPVSLVFGKFDRLIPPPNDKEWENWKAEEITILSSGHDLFSTEEGRKGIFADLK